MSCVFLFTLRALLATHPFFKFQSSAIEPFRSPLPGCGTLYRRTSRRRHHWLFFSKLYYDTYWIYCEIHFV